MIPRKKEPRRAPEPVAPPVDEECEGCLANEEDCCAETFVAKDDKKTTTQ